MKNRRTGLVKAIRKIESDLAEVIAYHSNQIGVRGLAAQIGVSPTTVSLMNNGHVPDYATLQKIADWADAL